MRHENASGPVGSAAAQVTDTPEQATAGSPGPAAAAVREQPPGNGAVEQVIPGPDGVVVLPPGVDLSEVHVSGRNLVVDLPDGTHMVIVDGAIFVPQLIIGGVEVPAVNLAALLIDAEPKPAAGRSLSSGGNFAVEVPPLDPGVPLGDLIPPTELTYHPPEFREVNLFEDDQPEVVIQPDGQPAAVNAIDNVNEAGLPIRNGGEPAGSGESADGDGTDNDDPSEATSGIILYEASDGLGAITINGVEVTAVGQAIAGQYGTMTITSIAHGAIGYTYTLSDNTSGDTTSDVFTVVVTDADGDSATGTLTIDIVDDVPTARNDIDAIGPDGKTADGNVMTGAGTVSGAAGADTVGADNAHVTGVHQGTTGGFVAVTGAGATIHGQYGTLTLFADGSYHYTRDAGAPDGVNDVFTYQLTDGDGDTSRATLTITIPDFNEPPTVSGSAVNVSEEGLAAGIPDNVGNPDTTNNASASGNIGISDPDGDATTVALGVPAGSYTSGGVAVVWAVSSDGHTLTGTAGGETVVTVTINDSGAYQVVLSAPFDQPDVTIEDSIAFTIPVNVSDGSVTVPSTIVVTVEDDSPTASQALVTGTVDEDGLPGGIPGGPGDVAGTATVASGSVATLFHSGADTPLTYSLLSSTAGLPSLTSGGVAVTYAVAGDTLTASAGGEAVFTFALGSDGNFTFTLLQPLDHPTLNGQPGDDTENDLSIAFGSLIRATDADGDSVTASGDGLVITINDDTPHAEDDSATLTIHIDSLGVDPVLAEWTHTVLSSGSPITFDRDGDGLTDEIRWGTGNKGRSGYGFVDNPALVDGTVLTSQSFSLGTFTHYNNPIDPPELQSTTLTVNFVAHINGQDIPVGPIEITFIHDETKNTSDPEASRDVIMITSETTTIMVEGVAYELQVRGLVDQNGDVVTTVKTYEGQANSFDLLVRFVQTDAVEVTGNVLVNDSSGADDPIGVVAAAGFNGSADSSADAQGNYQVHGQFGDLTLNADGSYTYTLTADVLSVPAGSVEHFVYTIEDFDGDRTTAKLDITLSPEQAAPLADLAPAAADESAAGLHAASLVADPNAAAITRMAGAESQNNVLLGAIAAAGLATDSTVMAHDPSPDGGHPLPGPRSPGGDGTSNSNPSVDGHDPVAGGLANHPRETVVDHPHGHASHGEHDGGNHSLTDAVGNVPPVPAELLQATAVAPPAPAQSTLTSGGVTMPSAAMLAAANAGAATGDGPARHNADVGQVLADALGNSGHHGPAIDALLDAATGRGVDVHAAADALASHGDAVVPAWDTASFAAFPVLATMMMMAEHPMLHPDAAQTAS
ncbi:MAG: choice-of-anchor K domain-containing protein [Sphingomicrobium sp.]